MKNRSTVVCYIILFFAFFSSCTPSTDTDDEIIWVATTSIVADAVKNIGGEKVKVISLMGHGVDPHLYKAVKSDLDWLQKADIIFYNGLHLEGKMTEVLEKLSKSKKVIAFSDGVPTSKLRKPTPNANVYDPHIWFDVQLWKSAISDVSVQIQKTDTANAAYYALNTSAYLMKLDSLDAYVRSKINSIPEGQRMLITAHDAFGYFGAAYNMDVKGLQGISTVSEYGIQDVMQLVNFIIEKKVPAVFVETSVSAKSIEAVIEGCRKRGHKVKQGGTLYSDALGPENSEANTYIGMVKKNVDTIVNAFKYTE
ncbi:MAG: zinc ABC transporter substrate-binding protein [Cytophagaceae bacterium]|nr:zinc ABC transporter substrate-binding protein [Cytophagaceae bacterium]MDW8455282.1 zinc ABC transporter substrate-binding protein [Cytophagaceae bacterium]